MKPTQPRSRTATPAWRATRERMKRKWKRLETETGEPTRCWICKRPVELSGVDYRSPWAIEVDHVVSPLDRPDLEFTDSNLKPSHKACNRQRSRPKAPTPITPPRDLTRKTTPFGFFDDRGRWNPIRVPRSVAGSGEET